MAPLRPIPGATFALPSDAQPGDVLFNGDGTRLVGTRVGTSQVDSFTIDHWGRAVAAPGSPFPAQGLGPFGSEFRPTDPNQLFVSNAHNVGAGTGTVSAFNDAPNGTLTPIGSSPFGDLQTAPCWVEISHDGRFLFTVNTASGTISRYAIGRDGSLALLGSTSIRATGGVGAVDARLSPDGHWLFVDESAAHAVGAFAVDGGNLTELDGLADGAPGRLPRPPASLSTSPPTNAAGAPGSNPARPALSEQKTLGPQQRTDLAGDLEVLAGLDHDRPDARTRSRDLDVPGTPRSTVIARRIDKNSEKRKALGSPGPDLGVVLADAAGEREHVEPSQRGRHRSDQRA